MSTGTMPGFALETGSNWVPICTGCFHLVNQDCIVPYVGTNWDFYKCRICGGN